MQIAFDWGPRHIQLHTTLEGPWPHCMMLEVSWNNLRTLSVGLSQFHGHGSWLVCEVALPKPTTTTTLLRLQDWLCQQFHGHGSWLVCEVALPKPTTTTTLLRLQDWRCQVCQCLCMKWDLVLLSRVSYGSDRQNLRILYTHTHTHRASDGCLPLLCAGRLYVILLHLQEVMGGTLICRNWQAHWQTYFRRRSRGRGWAAG